LAAAVGYGIPAKAAKDPLNFTVTFTKRIACGGFDFLVEGLGRQAHRKQPMMGKTTPEIGISKP
jgi:hypothetical protein